MISDQRPRFLRMATVETSLGGGVGGEREQSLGGDKKYEIVGERKQRKGGVQMNGTERRKWML